MQELTTAQIEAVAGANMAVVIITIGPIGAILAAQTVLQEMQSEQPE